MESVGAENIGLWADLGHGQVQENLGLIPTHEAWFERYSGRLVGVHFHGMGGVVDDHWAPTADNMDWGMVRHYVGPDTLLVAELSFRTNALGDVVRGLRYLDAFLRASPHLGSPGFLERRPALGRWYPRTYRDGT